MRQREAARRSELEAVAIKEELLLLLLPLSEEEEEDDDDDPPHNTRETPSHAVPNAKPAPSEAKPMARPKRVEGTADPSFNVVWLYQSSS